MAASGRRWLAVLSIAGLQGGRCSTARAQCARAFSARRGAFAARLGARGRVELAGCASARRSAHLSGRQGSEGLRARAWQSGWRRAGMGTPRRRLQILPASARTFALCSPRERAALTRLAELETHLEQRVSLRGTLSVGNWFCTKRGGVCACNNRCSAPLQLSLLVRKNHLAHLQARAAGLLG